MSKKGLLALFVLSTYASHAQQISDDGIFLQKSVEATVDIYTKTMGNQHPLYVGVEYTPPVSTHNEFPYFKSDLFENGNIILNGVSYFNIPLMYDLTSGKVVTELGNTTIPIELVEEKISAFNIGPYNFIRIQNDTSPSLPQSGFYELLYPGPSMVIVSHKKVRQDVIRQNVDLHKYVKKETMYIRKDKAFYKVKSVGSIKKVFPDKKRSINALIKAEKLNFTENRYHVVSRIAEFCDTSTQENSSK